MLPKQDERFTVLDSLRGLAALAVVFWHLALTLLDAPAGSPYRLGAEVAGFWRLSPLYPLIAGREAVIIFFILSGFVLSLPWVRGQRVPYGPFFVKRVCRIYLPYLATVALTFAAYALLGGRVVPELGAWFNTPWQRDPSAAEVVNYALLVGSFEHEPYNIVIWSLVHEMRVSLAFPLLMVPVMRWRWPVTLGAFLGVSALGTVLSATVGRGTDYAGTLHYLVFFVVGALLAKHRADVVAWWRRGSRPLHLLLGAFAFALYSYARVLSSFWNAPRLAWDAEDLLVGVGAVVLIVWLLASRPAGRVMEYPPLVFLGRISYSLYLLHLLVLFSLVRVLPGSNIYLLLPVALALSVGLAWLSYRVVELPSMRLGRYLAGLGRPQRHPNAQARPVSRSPRTVGRAPGWRGRRIFRVGGRKVQRPQSVQAPLRSKPGK